LHRRNFPDDLFTLAGEGVLVQLFREFVPEVSLAARLDGQLVGYAVGTLNKSRFMRRMVRRHGAILAAGIGPAILNHAGEAPGYVAGFFRWMVRRRSQSGDRVAVSMYEAISKDARSLGIPPLFFLELHARWMVLAEQRGARRIEGQVTDARMLAALSRLGYRLERSITTRSGQKHYITCDVPAEEAHRFVAR
jgi:hypothetical protein